MQSRNILSTEQQIPDGIVSSLKTLTSHIGMFQQIQRLFHHAGLPEVTLADVVAFFEYFQQEYGSTSSVEDVIQALVAQHLLLQCQARQKLADKLAA